MDFFEAERKLFEGLREEEEEGLDGKGVEESNVRRDRHWAVGWRGGDDFGVGRESLTVVNRGGSVEEIAMKSEEDPVGTLKALLRSGRKEMVEVLFQLGNLSRYGSVAEEWLEERLKTDLESVGQWTGDFFTALVCLRKYDPHHRSGAPRSCAFFNPCFLTHARFV